MGRWHRDGEAQAVQVGIGDVVWLGTIILYKELDLMLEAVGCAVTSGPIDNGVRSVYLQPRLCAIGGIPNEKTYPDLVAIISPP
jgi:hypothetical protein